MTCTHCGETVSDRDRSHWNEATGARGARGMAFAHRGLCCDCFDLKIGRDLADINSARTFKGQAPIPAPPVAV